MNLMALLLILLTGCESTILETPVGEGIDPTLVNLKITLTVDPKIEPYGSSNSAQSRNGTHDVRWIIELFRDEIGGKLEERMILTEEPNPEGKHSIQIEKALHAARYHLVAWMEYVDNDSSEDKYYKVSSLGTISIQDAGQYIGNEDHKDTFVARKEMDLREYRNQWNITVEQTVTLQRPMAKIELITTDVEKFLEKINRKQTGTSAGSGTRPAQNNLSDLQVEVAYTGYFPSGFNAYTNKPNDACTGLFFAGQITPLSSKEARLASDYIFVNGTESAVMVDVTIRNARGTLLNTIEGIRVPIVRGRLTTLRDEFLTRSYSPGIGIDPGFDGEIDIVIPD